MTSKRNITTANELETLKPVLKAVIFARLDFASGVQRFHTEIGPITATHPVFGAEVYTGLGDFGGMSSGVKESISGAPQTLMLSLTGLSSLVTTAITDDYFRRDAEVMLGLEDEAGDLVADPEILFSGFMDKVDISYQKNLAQMTMHLESRGTNLLKASDRRFTDEDKQAEVSGDLMGEYIYRMIDLTLQWGNKLLQNPFGRETPFTGPAAPGSPGSRK